MLPAPAKGRKSMTKSDKTLYMKWGICVVLALLCALIPTGEVYTSQVKIFFVTTVLALALLAFDLVPTFLVAIVLPAVWIFFKVAETSVVLSPWVSTTFLMIPGALFMAASLEDCGLLKRLAYYLMCKVKGKYFAFMIGLFFVGFLLNIMTAGRGYLILAPLAAGLCLSLNGMGKNLGAGLALATMVGGCTTHAFTYQAVAWGAILKMGADYIPVNAITPLGIIIHNWPLIIVCLLILFVGSKMFKPEMDLTNVTYFDDKLKEMGPISRREIMNIVMLGCILLYIFTVSIHKMDVNLGFAIIPFMVFLPGINGADEKTLTKVNYSIVFFVAACMAIGTVASSLGMGAIISDACRTILMGSTSPFAIMALVFAIVFILNFFMTPMAIFALMTAPILALATELGFSAIPFAYAINACSEAIVLPYEYVPYLIVFSFGMITVKDFFKANIMRSILFFAGFLLILVPYWMLIGIL